MILRRLSETSTLTCLRADEPGQQHGGQRPQRDPPALSRHSSDKVKPQRPSRGLPSRQSPRPQLIGGSRLRLTHPPSPTAKSGRWEAGRLDGLLARRPGAARRSPQVSRWD